MKTLETNRLILRDWNYDDLGCEVYDTKAIQYLISAKNNYALVLKDNNMVIGSIGLNEDAENDLNVKNVGIILLEEYRNKGLMSEALECVFANTEDGENKFRYINTINNMQKDSNKVPIDLFYYRLNIFDTRKHYDTLIDENNDPVHDPKQGRAYMDKWDGQAFIDELQLSKNKNVLEIGVGTGRLAVKAAPLCGKFTGIDISPKTIERAKQNLAEFWNINLICDNFMMHRFDGLFDVIYSSLTFMHIEDKFTAINKVAGLLAPGGRFVLSIDKNPSNCIAMVDRIIKIFPDNPDYICGYIKAARLKLEKQFETEFSYIFVAIK